MDSRIVPGFRYRVRCIGDEQWLFDGEARRLDSIGLGYGRRLTFQGDRLNNNDCYFWSDSSPTGFAFSIQALKEGDVFTLFNSDSIPIGEVSNYLFPASLIQTSHKAETYLASILYSFNRSNCPILNSVQPDNETDLHFMKKIANSKCWRTLYVCNENISLSFK